jgi:hypothetical protein
MSPPVAATDNKKETSQATSGSNKAPMKMDAAKQRTALGRRPAAVTTKPTESM